MNLKKLLILEIAIAVIVLVLVIFLLGALPFLASSKQNSSIGLYNEKVYGNGTLTLARGQTVAATQFNYTTYDPVILIINVTVQNCQSPGNITFACNGKIFGSLYADAENPQATLTAISVSGADWVEPQTSYSFVFGNEVTFTSEPENGYEGILDYTIIIRGSR